MYQAMTEQLRLALETAQAQARQLNNDFVGTEHLSLGLLAAKHASDGESEAVRAVRTSGISLEELRTSLVKALPHGDEAPVITGDLPFSPNAKHALNAAIVSAQSVHEPRVSTRLLLRALLVDPGSEIRASLRACGADLDCLQTTLDEPAKHPED
jgi:ATP-dependent Clp protease ATP-binding subunit ClpC